MKLRLPPTVVVPALLVVLVVALAAADAASAGRVAYDNTLAKSGSGEVTIRVYKSASFRVRLKAPTQGRARLYLLGPKAPRGGPLLDTRAAACERAAGSSDCRGAYEPLPAGAYTFRVVWRGPKPADVALRVRW